MGDFGTLWSGSHAQNDELFLNRTCIWQDMWLKDFLDVLAGIQGAIHKDILFELYIFCVVSSIPINWLSGGEYLTLFFLVLLGSLP